MQDSKFNCNNESCNDLADTYQQGLTKIERLQYEENVLSVESGDNTSEVQEKMTIALKQKEMLKKVEKMKAKFIACASTSSVTTSVNIEKKNDETIQSKGSLISFLIYKTVQNIFN